GLRLRAPRHWSQLNRSSARTGPLRLTLAGPCCATGGPSVGAPRCSVPRTLRAGSPAKLGQMCLLPCLIPFGNRTIDYLFYQFSPHMVTTRRKSRRRATCGIMAAPRNRTVPVELHLKELAFGSVLALDLEPIVVR